MPQKVVAWAIAIEKYGEPNLKISDVGAWALDFLETMQSKGAHKLILSSSLLVESAYAGRIDTLTRKDLIRRGADVADIQNILDEICGDALILYWVGHGIMAPSRQLLCADSRRMDDLRCIDAGSLLKHLRSAEFPRLQIGFFECCAQVVTRGVGSTSLGGDGTAPTRQYFYYASSAAETASASTARPGFSSSVLQALASVPEIPPDPEALFSELNTSFNNLVGSTRPAYLELTSGSGDLWSSGFTSHVTQIEAAAAVAQLTRSQFERLWKHALNSGKTAVEFADVLLANELPAFIAAFRASSPTSAEPTLLERAWEHIELEREFEPRCLGLRLLWPQWQTLYKQVANEEMRTADTAPTNLPDLLLGIIDQQDPRKRLPDFVKILELAARRSSQARAAKELRRAIRERPDLSPVYKAVLSNLGPDTRRLLKLGIWIFVVGIVLPTAGAVVYLEWPPPQWSFSSHDAAPVLGDWSGHTTERNIGRPTGVCESRIPDNNMLVVTGEPVVFQRLRRYQYQDFRLMFRVNLCRHQKELSWLIRYNGDNSYYRFDLEFNLQPYGLPQDPDNKVPYGSANIRASKEPASKNTPSAEPHLVKGAASTFQVSALADNQQVEIYLDAQNRHGECHFSYNIHAVPLSNQEIENVHETTERKFLRQQFFSQNGAVLYMPTEFVVEQGCLGGGSFGFIGPPQSPLRIDRVELNTSEAAPPSTGGRSQ